MNYEHLNRMDPDVWISILQEAITERFPGSNPKEDLGRFFVTIDGKQYILAFGDSSYLPPAFNEDETICNDEDGRDWCTYSISNGHRLTIMWEPWVPNPPEDEEPSMVVSGLTKEQIKALEQALGPIPSYMRIIPAV